MRSHIYTTMYGCKFASVPDTPVVLFDTDIPVDAVLVVSVMFPGTKQFVELPDWGKVVLGLR